MTAKNENFHFDEMVWRDDSGLINQAVTELTAIKDDVEFEKRMFLIRIARQVSGLGNYRLRHRTTRLFGYLLQIPLLNVCRPILLICEFALDKGEMLRGLINGLLAKRAVASPDKKIVISVPGTRNRISSPTEFLPHFVGKRWVSSKGDDALAVRVKHRSGGNNFIDFHALIVACQSIRDFVKAIGSVW